MEGREGRREAAYPVLGGSISMPVRELCWRVSASACATNDCSTGGSGGTWRAKRDSDCTPPAASNATAVNSLQTRARQRDNEALPREVKRHANDAPSAVPPFCPEAVPLFCLRSPSTSMRMSGGGCGWVRTVIRSLTRSARNKSITATVMVANTPVVMRLDQKDA